MGKLSRCKTLRRFPKDNLFIPASIVMVIFIIECNEYLSSDICLPICFLAPGEVEAPHLKLLANRYLSSDITIQYLFPFNAGQLFPNDGPITFPSECCPRTFNLAGVVPALESTPGRL